MFYAQRLGQMMVPGNGQWGARSFTDPALTFGGGLRVNLTDRLYVTPDLRGVVVVSGGDRFSMMTMNVGFGVRF